MKRWIFRHPILSFTALLVGMSGLVLGLIWPGWLMNSWQVWQAKKVLSPVIEQINTHYKGKGNYPNKIDDWLPAQLPILLRKSNSGGLLYGVSTDRKSFDLEFPDGEAVQPSDREYIELHIYTDREGWIHLHTLRDRNVRP